MHEEILRGLALIIILGITAQWFAWRINIPSILALLVFGFIFGPVTGVLDPDHIFGDLLLPVVSMSVAIILFDGGLSLRWNELKHIGKVLWSLITIGVLITWLGASVGAYYILELPLNLSILLGSILVVTGPTVIGPLMKHVRPTGKVGQLLKWEGIVIDPVGALLALLVFEVILIGSFQEASVTVASMLIKTHLIGGLIGVFSAWLLVMLLKWYLIPEHLQEVVSLMFVLASFVISNHFQDESGLFTVTLMGIILGSQNHVSVKHIMKFKEHLGVLIISSVFILLSARLQMDDIMAFNGRHIGFLCILMLLIRPMSVFVSSLGSSLNWKEKLFVGWMAPRGIVAAAISSVFALALAEKGVAQSESLVPITFFVIIGTVLIYGISASPLARVLGLSNPNPQGLLILGAHDWARIIAKEIKDLGFQVLLVDTNRSNEYKARMEGFETFHGTILNDVSLNLLDLNGIGRFLALTSNEEANALAAMQSAEVFGRSHVYQIAPEEVPYATMQTSKHWHGRYLFADHLSFDRLSALFQSGAELKTIRLSEEFDYDAYQKLYGNTAVPFFLITEDMELKILTANMTVTPRIGQKLICLVF